MVYFSPLIEGKRLMQSDITHWQGMSKEISDFRAKTGEEPLWTNSMFGGMPAYQISVKYKANLVKHVDNFLQLGLPTPANYVFLYFIGFYLLLLVLGVSPWISLAGSIAFAFSSYFFIIFEAGHNSKAHAIAYMAPVLAGIILSYRGKYLLGGVITALALALELNANHLQIAYYLLLIILVFGIVEFIYSIKEKKLLNFSKSTGVLIIAALLAIGTGFSNLWSTYEYGKYTIRGKSELTTEKENRTSGLDKDYTTQWSYGIDETMTLLIPGFKGGASVGKLSTNSSTYKILLENQVVSENQAKEIIKSLPLYWGRQPGTSGPVYVGASVILLFLIGIFIVKGRFRWWLLSITILSILLSWGKNFMPFTNFFLDYIPAYDKFRAVTMILVIAEFAIPLLAFISLRNIFQQEHDNKKIFNVVKYVYAVLAIVCLIFALFGSGFYDFTSPADANYAKIYPDWLINAIREDRSGMLRADAFRSLIFITLMAAALWAFLFKKIKKEYMIAGIIALMLIDLWTVNKRYVDNDKFVSKSSFQNPFLASKADSLILKDPDPDFRVLNVTVDPFNDASTSYFHKSIGGYHGAKLRRYQELIDHQINMNNMSVLNMLNTKYFIVPDQQRNPVVQINMQALGHAWFVDSIKYVSNADAELLALSKFNPKTKAIVDKRFEPLLKNVVAGTDSNSKISLVSYAPNHLQYTYIAAKKKLAVFSEIYYEKGWNAYIDNMPVSHLRANYVLRAMMLPSGKHTIDFRFEPKCYKTGEKVSFASSLLLLMLVVGMLGKESYYRFFKK